jgi:hypothetical protein
VTGWRDKFETMANRVVGTTCSVGEHHQHHAACSVLGGCIAIATGDMDLPSSYVCNNATDAAAAAEMSSTPKLHFHRAVAAAMISELEHHRHAANAVAAASIAKGDPLRSVRCSFSDRICTCRRNARRLP